MQLLNLTLIPRDSMTDDQWVEQRNEGVGGSDMSVILRENPYATPVELFYQKLGLTDPPNLDENEAVHSGSRSEDILLEDSCYYEPSDPKAYVRNFKGGKIKNHHVKFPFIILNDKFPWLRCNIDGAGFPKVYADKVGMLDGLSKAEQEQALKSIEKIIEIKTISSQSANMWIDNIPKGYLSQVVTYCIPFLEINPDIYGEIYSKVDGVKFEYHRVELTPERIEEVITESYDFWERVLKGREILAEENTEKAVHFLKDIQPEIYTDEEDRVAKFYSDTYLKKMKEWDNRIKGGEAELELAIEYLELKAERKSLEKDPEFIENKIARVDRKIKELMTENECTIIDLGERGKISWNRRLYVNLK